MKTRKIKDGYYLVDHTSEEHRDRDRITNEVLRTLVKEVPSKSAGTAILASYNRARAKSGTRPEYSKSNSDAVHVK